MMPNGDPQEGLFYPTLTVMIDSYIMFLPEFKVEKEDQRRLAADDFCMERVKEGSRYIQGINLIISLTISCIIDYSRYL